ncbi:DUF927 domain-containing protein [Streptomyces collinus]|uniref:DUF927 domain-containing protein n=1 Tax=Streptomyces collinus TaxID=42684 RepID=UPI0036A800EF
MTTEVSPETTEDQKTADAFRAFQREKARQRKALEDLNAADSAEKSEFEQWKEQRARNEQKAKEDQEKPRVPRPEFPYADVFGLPASISTPDGYKVTRDGVYARQNTHEGPQWVRIAFAPLVVTTAYADADDDQDVELAWTDGRKVVRRLVSRGIARRGRRLVEELGSAGLPVIESDARAVERYLAEFEVRNRDLIPSRYVARYLGWQPDGTFVSSPGEGVRVSTPYPEQERPAQAHRRSGSLAGWRAAIAALEGETVPRVVVAAGLASALLHPLAVDSFTLDLSCRSTKGKTTVLQAGLSVWADPSPHADALSTWRTTHIAIEKRLNLVRGIVTALDETMTVERPEIIADVLYDVPKGTGKARSAPWPSQLKWETILLSTGERPALSYSTHQGAAARVLTITRPPFGEGGGPAAVALRENVLAHHGHAGPEFARHLVESLDTHGPAGLQERHRELTEQLRGSSDMTARRAPMVAALALAEALACRWGVLPYEPLPLKEWQALFTDVEDGTDNRAEMALDQLRNAVASSPKRLFRQNISTRGDEPTGGWVGIIPGDGSWVALSPSWVREVLNKEGYSLDAVRDQWIDEGYLKLSESQRPAYLIKKKLLGVQAKYLIFLPPALEVGPFEA